jgi:hypothetical protein
MNLFLLIFILIVGFYLQYCLAAVTQPVPMLPGDLQILQTFVTRTGCTSSWCNTNALINLSTTCPLYRESSAPLPIACHADGHVAQVILEPNTLATRTNDSVYSILDLQQLYYL